MGNKQYTPQSSYKNTARCPPVGEYTTELQIITIQQITFDDCCFVVSISLHKECLPEQMTTNIYMYMYVRPDQEHTTTVRLADMSASDPNLY